MFTIPRKNVIESDEGFSVEVLGMTGINYSVGTNTLFVDSEILEGPAGLAIYSDSIKAWNDGKAIKEPERGQIIDNLKRAFRHRGFEIQVL